MGVLRSRGETLGTSRVYGNFGGPSGPDLDHMAVPREIFRTNLMLRVLRWVRGCYKGSIKVIYRCSASV